jgi:hypothetical protein
MGGNINVTSTKDEGSVFTFSFPFIGEGDERPNEITNRLEESLRPLTIVKRI